LKLRIAAAAWVLLCSGVSASAQEARVALTPAIAVVKPSWDAAEAEARTLTGTLALSGAQKDALGILTNALKDAFAPVAASSVPVLLPFDTAAYLRARASAEAGLTASYMSGFRETGFFLAGPAGYDAAFSVRASEVPALSEVSFSYPVVVEISASALHYRLPPTAGAVELPAGTLAREFPKLRRFILESYLRYSFERFGVTYVVSISCFDGRPRARWISCKSADPIARHFLNALNLVGGTPVQLPEEIASAPAARPERVSADFTYHPPGKLLPGTGFSKQDGVADMTVYAPIRFPFAQAPAFANSQSFMNWGDCDQTGRTPHPRGRKGSAYRCRVNFKPLVFDESAAENYSYPWRDNFCEHRYFYVGQCPAGQGHQGQDIRPSRCKLENDGADRCQPYQDDVVAVREGMILRSGGQEAIFLTSNGPQEHVRFRYMHMHPDYLDADNVLNGRAVREGEVLGTAGNFNRRENLTSYHLHFEMMVTTQDGWVRVNPYMTLIASYERLLGERGREVEEPEPAADPAAAPSSVGMSSGELGTGEVGNGKAAEPARKLHRYKLRKKRRR